jgi:DNA-binding HxlR family transcriptional regulator
VRRRKIDGCPIAGALQMIGDKWTLLVARDLAAGAKRTMELHTGLFPISSRTLVARLRDMEKDKLVERIDFGGNPPHIEYRLTERGQVLLPLVDALRRVGQALDCNDCEERKEQLGFYCEACPNNFESSQADRFEVEEPMSRPASRPRRQKDDSIVLL